MNPEQRVADVVRTSYGRLLALLAAPVGDLSAAEDALADALERALTHWVTDGVPANPDAWVLTVARNRLRDRWRSHAYRTSVPLPESADTTALFADQTPEPGDIPVIPDRRLELMLVCAHPAIAVNVRTPLMLQTVLGVDAAAIAAAFVVEPATMAQRLVRAKRRIRDARIPFAIPEPEVLAERLPAVMEAIYGAYAIDWTAGPGEVTATGTLPTEALHLATTLATLLPGEPEPAGLAALICFSEARRTARWDADGTFVPLDAQNPTDWDARLIEQGEVLLTRAHGLGRPGRFQYEAAIQSAHCRRASGTPVDPDAIRRLHRALLRVAPSLGAAVAAAAVEADVDGPNAGIDALDAISDPAAATFQPAWATRAHLLAAAGRSTEAAQAYRRAIALTDGPTTDGMRRYLAARLAAANPQS